MKILVIRLSSLGDVTLVTSPLAQLGEKIDDLEIHCMTKPQFAQIFRMCPAIDNVVEWTQDESVFAMARKVKWGGYDLVVDLHANLRTHLLRTLTPSLSWSVYRKGAVRRRMAVLLGKPDLLPADHVVDRYNCAFTPLGRDLWRRPPLLKPASEAVSRVGADLTGGGWDGEAPLVALAPGARWATKAWPERHWVDLLAAISTLKVFPFLVGGYDETELCGRILEASGAPGVNLAGRTTIEETAAALKLATMLVTNDSAPLHISAGVGTPVVALFGPTVAGFGFFPIGEEDILLEERLDCRPCSLHGDEACPKGHHDCLEKLTPERVCGVVATKIAG